MDRAQWISIAATLLFLAIGICIVGWTREALALAMLIALGVEILFPHAIRLFRRWTE